MSKYKERMIATGIMQKEVLANIQRVDPRVDKPLLSKIVNDLCLPNKPTLESICKTLRCEVLDLYDKKEIDLLSLQPLGENEDVVVEKRIFANGKIFRKEVNISSQRKKADIYNLTVELDRKMAMRVLSKDSLKKLGYDGVTDFVRKSVEALIVRLEEIEKQEN